MQYTASRTSSVQKFAVPIYFILLGIMYATWAARIPAIRDALRLDAEQLGFALLGAGVGAVASFPLAAWLVAHLGARRAAWFAGLALLAAMPCLALAPGLPWLIAATLMLGSASSCFDVSINALGAEAEKNAQRSIMSMLHAWFCVGTLSGALLGSAMAGMAVTPLAHFSATAALSAVPLWLGYRALPPDRPHPDEKEKRFAIPHGPLVALGVIGFCGAIAEGSIADWSGVFLKDQLAASNGVAPLAFAGFSAMMLAARLVGDRFKDRFGARAVVSAGALVAAAGVFIAVPAISVPATLAGFALTGLGLATLFPFVFSAAGRHGPVALAGVATLSYSGGLIGPPTIGFLAHLWGLQAGLAFVGLLAILVALAAARARWLD